MPGQALAGSLPDAKGEGPVESTSTTGTPVPIYRISAKRRVYFKVAPRRFDRCRLKSKGGRQNGVLRDETTAMFRYGYFVVLPNGIAVPSGFEAGTTADFYKVGSSMGVTDDKEGIVVDVVKGYAAELNGFDVMVFIVENEPGAAPWVPSREAIDRAIRALNAVPAPPPTIRAVVDDKRMVATWNGLHPRPVNETFHEFLIEVPFKGTFDERWHRAELLKVEPRRHVVEQWLRALHEDQQKQKAPDHKPGQVDGAPAIAATTELIALAHDLYLLQKVQSLPRRLIRRLQKYEEFQGARYEVAIAAAFVKCGFEVTWVNDRHSEFVARNNQTFEEVAVETKSRYRPDTVSEQGVLLPEERLRADVDRLYNDALGQDPGDMPFVIFIDVNLPPNAFPEETVKWRDEIVGRWQNNQTQVSLLCFTNFAWHYKPEDRVSRPDLLVSVPLVSARPLRTPETLRCLQVALETYGIVPNEY
jgi:hypothetical protein